MKSGPTLKAWTVSPRRRNASSNPSVTVVFPTPLDTPPITRIRVAVVVTLIPGPPARPVRLVRARVGLLASGSSYSPRLPGSPPVAVGVWSPVTVTRSRRIRTAFPGPSWARLTERRLAERDGARKIDGGAVCYPASSTRRRRTHARGDRSSDPEFEQSFRGHHRASVDHEANRELTRQHRTSSGGYEAIERADGPRSYPLTLSTDCGTRYFLTGVDSRPGCKAFSLSASQIGKQPS